MKKKTIPKAWAMLTGALLVSASAAAVNSWGASRASEDAGEKKMCVVIHEAQRSTSFDLEDRPIVSFTDTDVKLECAGMTVLYPLDNYLKMTIEEVDVATDMKTISTEAFKITGSVITAQGCESLSLYGIDGQCLLKGKANAEGVATLSISQLPAGTYIVVLGNQSFKINKRR
jgi:hypothetical protein